jgi:hypothetical protein
MPLHDPIVDEIRAFRAEHAASFGYDVEAIIRDLIRQQDDARTQGKEFVKSAGKKCKPGLCYTPLDEETPVALPVDMPTTASDSTTTTE